MAVPGGRTGASRSPRNPQRRILHKSMATTTAGSSAQASSSAAAHTPILATGDWTKNLVHLAKTAELKCVCLSLPCRRPPHAHRRRCAPVHRPPVCRTFAAYPGCLGWWRFHPSITTRAAEPFSCCRPCGTACSDVKETCPDPPAPHRTHPLGACGARAEEQGDPGPQGAEEQVRICLSRVLHDSSSTCLSTLGFWQA